jgi:iron complex outermembrane receptor protein
LRRLAPGVLAAAFAGAAHAQTSDTLPTVTVQGSTTPSVAQREQLPTTTESINAARAVETINATSTEDLVKYLPDVLVRKRYIGDTQAPIASRTTGINASARTLILADDVWLSSYVGNNNTNGSPRWFMVAPEEIARVDVMYGPFAAEYPGNSYGAVVALTTRMPDRFEGSVKLGYGEQNFDLYGTHGRYPAKTASATVGSRAGAFSWWLSLNHLDADSQPITFGTVTPQAAPAGGLGSLPAASGGYADQNRTGMPIEVVSAGTITHTAQDATKLKLAYDLTPTLSAAYTLGYWRNRADASSQSYLQLNGAPYFGAGKGSVAIGGNAYSASAIAASLSSSKTEQDHLMQSLSLKTHDDASRWNWELVASNYRYLTDRVRSSTGFSSSAPNLYPDATTGGTGRIADAGGTGWTTLDAKGIWQADAHRVSFGLHRDLYHLVSPTYNTTDWVVGTPGALFSDARGTTRTDALWAQDVWRFAPAWTATWGARYERWQADNGRNVNTTGATATQPGTVVTIDQPRVAHNGVSPKATLAWAFSDGWRASASVGKALRFPTVGELYQSVSTGPTFTQANPYLRPENVLSSELAVERTTPGGRWRVSLFDERVRDALIAQTSTIAGQVVAYTQNVDRTHQQGIELVAQRTDVWLPGLDLGGSVTYVSGKILADAGYVPPAAAPNATATGKRTPYIPDWRATLTATYRPDARWAYTAAARYSGRMYASVDNSDVHPDTYMGFEPFVVADLRVHCQIDEHWDAAIGVDNVGNRTYWLYHPFPQRTWLAEARYRF